MIIVGVVLLPEPGKPHRKSEELLQTAEEGQVEVQASQGRTRVCILTHEGGSRAGTVEDFQ